MLLTLLLVLFPQIGQRTKRSTCLDPDRRSVGTGIPKEEEVVVPPYPLTNFNDSAAPLGIELPP
jgi:hypothetical protein